MTALATIRDRVEVMLQDTGNAIWDAAVIDEGINQALDQYSLVKPLHMETVITLPGDGHEIALSGIADLIGVLNVWWPYDSAATAETWPPNRVRGFRLWWDDAQAVLFLEIDDGAQPKLDDEVRVWYTKRQTIENFGTGDITSIQGEHESLIILGAAGHAAMSRTVDLIETAGTDLYQVGILGTWGQRKIREFETQIKALQRYEAWRGPSWGAGWALDKYDVRSGR